MGETEGFPSRGIKATGSTSSKTAPPSEGNTNKQGFPSGTLKVSESSEQKWTRTQKIIIDSRYHIMDSQPLSEQKSAKTRSILRKMMKTKWKTHNHFLRDIPFTNWPQVTRILSKKNLIWKCYLFELPSKQAWATAPSWDRKMSAATGSEDEWTSVVSWVVKSTVGN